MAFLIKDSDNIFVGCFGETSQNQFTFMATNCEKFFVEVLTNEVLLDRTEEMNDSIIYKQSKVIKTIQDGDPVACTIRASANQLRIDLKFHVNNRPLNIYFKLIECDVKDVGPLFTVGLMKFAIENSLMMGKLRKAVEAKDLEIEEYKRNGGILTRESLATRKFEFEEVKVKFQSGDRFTFNPSQLLNESNIPSLCQMIQAENVLDTKKEVKPKPAASTSTSQRSGKLKTASRIPVGPKFIEKKSLAYVNDDEAESSEAASPQSAEVAKKPRMIKKPGVVL